MVVLLFCDGWQNLSYLAKSCSFTSSCYSRYHLKSCSRLALSGSYAFLDLYRGTAIFLLNHFTFSLVIYVVFQVLFSNEKIGIGIGKTRDEAQVQAAEKALQNLESEYISLTSCILQALLCLKKKALNLVCNQIAPEQANIWKPKILSCSLRKPS